MKTLRVILALVATLMVKALLICVLWDFVVVRLCNVNTIMFYEAFLLIVLFNCFKNDVKTGE